MKTNITALADAARIKHNLPRGHVSAVFATAAGALMNSQGTVGAYVDAGGNIRNNNGDPVQLVALTFADDAARTAAVPAYEGQLGVQLDTDVLYLATGTSAGNWTTAASIANTTVSASTPSTSGTVTAGTTKADEFFYIVPDTDPIAALTFAFPSNANSRLGQRLIIYSTKVVTALTLSKGGQTTLGDDPAALAAGIPVIYQKSAASTWARVDASAEQDNINFPKEANHIIQVVTSATTDTAGGTLTMRAGAAAATNAAGGATSIVGGAGAGTGNGGAISVAGGLGGATSGVGGAASVVGGAGGTSAGVGGAVALTGGAATAAATAGGAATITGGLSTTSAAGGAVNITGGGVGTTGIGGFVAIAGGVGGTSGARDGGAASLKGGACGAGSTGAGGAASMVGGASGNGATGKGGAVAITGGASGSTNDDGGSVVIAGGAKSGSGISGIVRLSGVTVFKLTPSTITDTATLSVAQLLSGTIKATPTAAATYTMPTGAVLQAALPTSLAVGDSFDFSIVNVATNASFDITVATAATGITMYGNLTVASNDAVGTVSFATFRIVTTDVTGGAGTFDVYRIG